MIALPELPSLRSTSTVRFHELRVARDGKALILSSTMTASYLELDDAALRGIGLLQEGKTIGDAERALTAEYGTEYDLTQLVEFLTNRGFVARIDDFDLPLVENRRNGVDLSRWISVGVARSVASPVTLALVGLCAFLALIFGIHTEAYRPSILDSQITRDPFVNIFALFGGLLVATMLHELGHYFAARRFGLKPVIRASHRFYVIVLQTDVSDAWLLPKWKRIVVFLAGISVNVMLIAVAIVVEWAYYSFAPHNSSADFYALANFVAYVNFIPIIFQFFIFARTDLYFVVMTLLEERNLSRDATNMLVYRYQRFIRRITGDTPLHCPACKADVLSADAFCEGCLVPFAVPTGDVDVDFRFKSRLKIGSFAAFTVLGVAASSAYFAHILGSIVQHSVVPMMALLKLAISHGHLILAGKATAVLGLVGVQVGFFVYSMGRLAFELVSKTASAARAGARASQWSDSA